MSSSAFGLRPVLPLAGSLQKEKSAHAWTGDVMRYFFGWNNAPTENPCFTVFLAFDVGALLLDRRDANLTLVKYEKRPTSPPRGPVADIERVHIRCRSRSARRREPSANPRMVQGKRHSAGTSTRQADH